MLVLTRGLKQRIEIGNRWVTVTVVSIKGGKVRLGIEAPDDVNIVRQELVELEVGDENATPEEQDE